MIALQEFELGRAKGLHSQADPCDPRNSQNPRTTPSNRNTTLIGRQQGMGGSGRLRQDNRSKRAILDGLPEMDPALEMQEIEAQLAAQEAAQNEPVALPVTVPVDETPTAAASTTASTGPNQTPMRRPINPLEIKLDGQPRNGVQVMAMEERDNVVYFTVRDLRNNTTVRNVTMKSARDLWHYAISQYAETPGGPPDIDWQGEKADRAILNRSQRGGKMRYDVAMRDTEDRVRVFYGVTDDGLNETWRPLIARLIANSADAGVDTNGSEDSDANLMDEADLEAMKQFNRLAPGSTRKTAGDQADADAD